MSSIGDFGTFTAYEYCGAYYIACEKSYDAEVASLRVKTSQCEQRERDALRDLERELWQKDSEIEAHGNAGLESLDYEFGLEIIRVYPGCTQIPPIVRDGNDAAFRRYRARTESEIRAREKCRADNQGFFKKRIDAVKRECVREMSVIMLSKKRNEEFILPRRRSWRMQNAELGRDPNVYQPTPTSTTGNTNQW